MRRERVIGRAGERGSTLLIFPAAVLVVLALAAITIDLSALHSAHRRAERILTAIADDAAGVLDLTSVRRGDALTIDFPRARQQALADLARADLSGRIEGLPRIEPGPRPATITIEVELRLRRGLAGLIPGAPEYETVRMRAIGELVEGG